VVVEVADGTPELELLVMPVVLVVVALWETLLEILELVGQRIKVQLVEQQVMVMPAELVIEELEHHFEVEVVVVPQLLELAHQSTTTLIQDQMVEPV
jgi:hypothetical protein